MLSGEGEQTNLIGAIASKFANGDGKKQEMTSSRKRQIGVNMKTSMKNLINLGQSSELICQSHRSSHQVPSNNYIKINMNKLTRRRTGPAAFKLLLTSVIFFLLMSAQERRHPLNMSNSLVVQASTVGRIDLAQAHTAPLPPNTTAINNQPSQAANKQQVHQYQATFATPNQAINITHVTYDPLYDTIYLGATNTIYQLNGSDLSLQHEQSTGPVYDNPSCGIIDCRGFEDNMKLTQDINKLLVIDYQHKKLLSCGSTKQGACRRYQLNDIAQKEDLIPMAVAANDVNSTTFAFVAPARYTYDPASSTTPNAAATNSQLQQQQQVLYVASTYTTVGQSREMLVPAIGTRTLDEGPNLLGLYEHSFVESRIDINTHLRDYFLVNYMYGFASSSHIYFVTVQKKATSRDFEELGYHTRLARVCITDSSYNSYTEVDLKCIPNRRKSQQQKHNYFTTGQQQQDQPSDYPLLQDAIFVDAGSQLLQSLVQSDQLSAGFFSSSTSSQGGSPDDSKVLLGVFSSAKDHTQYAGDHSAICAFSLAQIEDKFNDNINSCYTGKMQSRNMEYIAGNVQECPKNGQGGNVVNFCHETLKINGTIPIVSEAAIQYYNTTLTAITATSHVNSQVKNIYSEHLSSELAANEQPRRDSLFRAGQAAPKLSSGTALRQHTVVFTGTSTGHIKKILLNNASNGVEFEDVQLDTQTILSDLHLHSSGNQLIAATPYKVFKIPAHNCAQYASCRECSQSRNPYCGWCLLKKSCTTKSECAGPALDQRSNSISSQEQSAASASSNIGAATRHQLQQPKWISSEASGKCIDLQSIVPDKIPMTSTGKVDLYIDRLPRLPKEHSYRCVFNRSEQTTATATQFGLSCPLPKLMDRQRNIQIQPGRDHAIVELAVRSSETNTDFLDGKITFFDCQRHTTCKDCLTTNWGCNWCLNENVCLFNTSKCDKTTSLSEGQPSNQVLSGLGQRSRQQSPGPIVVGLSAANQQRGSTLISNGPSAGSRTSNTINQVLQCPTFDVGHQQDILIADGSERELSIRVKNMPQFKGAMKCIVEIENYEIPLKAQVQEDRVICENSTYSYTADVGLLNAQLKVIYSESNIFIDRTNFTMYKCHLLGAYLNRPDCSLCQRIDQRFDCAWCSGSCQHRSRCSERPDEACPPPRIDFVHPLSGPTLGGTRVTIEGSNLGQSFEEIANRITIGNVPCKPIEEEYRPSNRIVCLTSPVLANTQVASGFSPDSLPGEIVVGNRAGYTIGGSKFHFKTVHLHTHQPRYGPQSGGTRVTLSGVNLNIGSSVQIFFDELPCLVEMSSLSSEQLVCRTTSSRQASRAIRHLKLIIDDAQIVRTDDVFYYTSDPIINRVSPLRAYLSGGRPINVSGANLTVIQAPRMAIYDAYTGRKVNESLCIAQDDTWMQCPAPAVNLQMIDLEYAEQQMSSLNSYEPNSQQQTTTISTTSRASPGGQRIFQQDESVKFKVGFIMDGVMQMSPSQLQTEIAYTSDPKLYPFASVQYRTMQEAELASVAAPNGQHNFQIELDTFLLQPSEPALVLYGEQLRAAVSEYEITVTVGKDLCNLTQLSQTRLVCSMPLDHMATPTDEEGHQTQRSLPLVVVRIGFNLRYELGFVQYHPQLVAQIDAIISNLSAGSIGVIDPKAAASRCLTHPIYKSYMPCENESALRRLSSVLLNLLMVAGYAMLGFCLLGLIYTGLFKGSRLKDRAMRSRAYKNQLARFESLERSLKNDCRVASLALQGDLNELVRHIELSGVPLLNIKHYIMKVFFPGINNHPLLLRPAAGSSTQNSGLGATTAAMLMVEQHQPSSLLPLPRAPKTTANDLPMEHFERLLLTKPFLLSFINTLERQPGFTIRDKVNVASLLMIVLMERLDYATDIMRTLLFQLVERSVNKLQQNGSEVRLDSDESHESELQDDLDYEDGSVVSKTTRRLTRRASNLLSGLPISKRHYHQAPGGRLSASQLGKMVNGGASSLMETTSVAAQMLLARVGHKTSPSEQNTFYQQQPHQTPVGNLIASPLDGTNYLTSDYMSTTAFNDNSIAFLPYKTNTTGAIRRNNVQLPQPPSFSNESCRSLTQRHQRRARSKCGSGAVANNAKLRRLRCKQQAQLMLRRTESIVEKMLTNWLALTMHEHLEGPVGRSLYLLFEALKSQLERGPIDAISGDAYYSLSEHKLLREPSLQFEVVNLYVIVDTDILHMAKQQQHSLLLDNACPQQLVAENLIHPYDHQTSIRNRQFSTMANNRSSQQLYSLNNTITLALRVLDCDTITQVKAKILSALYRNSAYTSRVGPDEVELSLRRHQPSNGHQTLISTNNQQQQQHQATVVLQDENFTSISSYNSTEFRQLNTLRHYGVTDQGIMLMKRLNRAVGQQASDDHYSNPYAEIQYGQCKVNSQQQTATVNANNQQRARNSTRAWHLTRSDNDRGAHLSDHSNDSSSSPSSHSPSMMLLGADADANGQQVSSRPNNMSTLHQQQFYHPSSSSTSSMGNVMDTHSTSANSNSIMNNIISRQHHQQHSMSNTTSTMMGNHQEQVQQPIYCQIGSISAQSQQAMGPGGSQYYCQIGANNQIPNQQHQLDYLMSASMYSSSNRAAGARDSMTNRSDEENNIYLARMLTSKGTIQKYVEHFFTTILTARSSPVGASVSQSLQLYDEAMAPVMFGDHTSSRRLTNGTRKRHNLGQSPSQDSGACPPAVKWIFDLLDEAALKNGITDENVIHAWKSNAFLLRFWVNFIKNPDYFLDVEKSKTMDASLSVIAQTLMDACASTELQKSQPGDEGEYSKLIFSKDLPKYRDMVRHFYRDVSSMRPVSDQDMIEQMSFLSMSSSNGGGKFDTNLALKELCVYAVNYGVEIMNTLNNDQASQQMDLSQELEQCFRSFNYI